MSTLIRSGEKLFPFLLEMALKVTALAVIVLGLALVLGRKRLLARYWLGVYCLVGVLILPLTSLIAGSGKVSLLPGEWHTAVVGIEAPMPRLESDATSLSLAAEVEADPARADRRVDFHFAEKAESEATLLAMMDVDGPVGSSVAEAEMKEHAFAPESLSPGVNQPDPSDSAAMDRETPFLSSARGPNQGDSQNMSLAFPWRSAIAVMWAAGCALMLLRLLASAVSVSRMSRGASRVTDPALLELFARARNTAGVTRKAILRTGKNVPSPVAIGVFRPSILLPESLHRNMPPQHLRPILVHELAHVQLGDYAVNILQRVAESLLFFHPLVWFISLRLRRLREEICDNWVLERYSEGTVYAKALMDLAGQAMHLRRRRYGAMGLYSHYARIRSRIERILSSAKRPTMVFRFKTAVILLCISAAIVGSLSLASLSARAVEERGAADEEKPAAPVIVEGEELTKVPFMKTTGRYARYELPALPVLLMSDGRAMVPAQRIWSDTGVNLEEGQIVSVSAAGQVRGCNRPPTSWALGPWGPEGTMCGEPEYGDKKACALIGKIEAGSERKEFYIGKELTFKAPLTGTFHLGVADLFHMDNEAAFVAEVKVDGKPVDFRTIFGTKASGEAETGSRITATSGGAAEPFDLQALPGKCVFRGTYNHRSRGQPYGTSEQWVVEGDEGALTVVTKLRSYTHVAVGDKEHRVVEYKVLPEQESDYKLEMAIEEGKVIYRQRMPGEEEKTYEIEVPEGSLFDPNTRPDPYCATVILLKHLALKDGESKEVLAYDRDNAGTGMATYRFRIQNKGKENVTVPAGEFEANHLMLQQLTTGDTWYKKRALHVTDFWVLDNGVIVKIFRHREPYEVELQAVQEADLAAREAAQPVAEGERPEAPSSVEFKVTILSQPQQVSDIPEYIGPARTETAEGIRYLVRPNAFRDGEPLYTDRTYALAQVPERYRALTYVQTANNDKMRQDGFELALEVNVPVTVYLAHDDRLEDKPEWLREFKDTGDDVGSDDPEQFVFSLYAKAYPAGKVVLGPNCGVLLSSMYLVIIEESRQQEAAVKSAAAEVAKPEEVSFMKTLPRYMRQELPPMPVLAMDDGRAIVPAQRIWSDTGLDVEQGQSIEFSADGRVRGCHAPMGDWAMGPWGPEGTLSEGSPYYGNKVCALIGKIESEGDVKEFYVGKELTLEAPLSGRLYLGVSDIFHIDNEGAFVVEVKVDGKRIVFRATEPSEVAAAKPKPAPAAEAKREGLSFIDLDPYVNSGLRGLQSMQGNDLLLDPGEQSIADTIFRIGSGVIQLRGPILDEWAPGRFPQEVKGIRVGLKFGKLHILHATGWGAGPHPIADGSHIGNYVIHYEDESTQEIPIKYGNHVRDWWTTYGDATDVSEGKTAPIRGNRRLFTLTWENPHPDRVVTMIDYTSTGTVCAPFLVAITAETEEAARPPEAKVQRQTFIDLDPYITTHLKDWHGVPGNDIALEPGVQRLGDNTFRIGEGAIELAGTIYKGMRPDRVEGIKVSLKFQKLHILHATGWGAGREPYAVPHGTHIGTYSIRYDDSSTEEIAIKYGVHVRDWWARENDPSEVSEGKVAWTGKADYPWEHERATTRLYSMTWQDPHPDRAVSTIDFSSTGTICGPFVVAMTAEGATPAPSSLAERKAQVNVDLEPYVNAPMTNFNGKRGNDLTIPSGEHRLAGVDFRVGERIIWLGGSREDNQQLPLKVEGIKIGSKLTKLHFLHATCWGLAEGEQIGSYVVHYEGGVAAEIPLVYGENIRNWWIHGDPRGEISQGSVAWKGRNPYAWSLTRIPVQLYATAWENPHSDKLVATMDFVSLNTECSPFLVAMTVEIEGPALTPEAKESKGEAEEERGYEKAFRDLYDELGRNYPAFGIKGIDWNKVGEELVPRAKEVKTDDEFGLLCLELVARLEDSHAYLMNGTAQVPSVEFPRYDPGFACLIDDREKPVVYYVDRGGPAEKAGVKVGMTVVSINGEDAEGHMQGRMKEIKKYSGYSSDRYLQYHAAQWLGRQMEQGAAVELEMEDTEGEKQSFRVPARLGVRYLPRLPVPIPGISDSGSVSWKKLEDNVGYIYVRRIKSDLIGNLDRAVETLKNARGLIVDVRGNSGGGFDASRALLNFSLDESLEPQRPRFKGQIALLIDARCISAGEGWASWFIANKRAKVFGETTAGASSRKTVYTLTNGLFKVQYPVKAYTGFLDRPIERRGLKPDIPLKQNANDLATGRDTVLGAARQFLLEQTPDYTATAPSPPAETVEAPVTVTGEEEYNPPDFEGFFPDDLEGARKLDAMGETGIYQSTLPDDELLEIVRKGLRRTRQRWILRAFGNRYIWGKHPQNPKAIEIMYHATDGPGFYNAIYFGLSVVVDKSPSILRRLVEICMREDDPNVLHRIAWGTKSQTSQILPYLAPYLNSGDEKTQEKARIVEKILKGELEAFAWAAEKAKARAEAFRDKLPEIKEKLLNGDSATRREALNYIATTGITLIMDDSFIEAWKACSTDPDWKIRNEVARTFGNHWIWGAAEQKPEAIELMLELSRDEVREVRSNSVYFGLSTVRDKSEEVVRRLLEIAMEDRERNMFSRIQWGLRGSKSTAANILEDYMDQKETNPKLASAAFDIYQDIVEKPPPHAERFQQ